MIKEEFDVDRVLECDDPEERRQRTREYFEALDEMRANSTLIDRWADPGNGSFYLFEALAFCLHTGLPVPSWASEAFVSGFERVAAYEARSWDEVFGPLLKGVDLKAAKLRAKMQGAVLLGIKEIQKAEPGVPINWILFDRVAENLSEKYPELEPFSGTWVMKLYYSSRNSLSTKV